MLDRFTSMVEFHELKSEQKTEMIEAIIKHLDLAIFRETTMDYDAVLLHKKCIACDGSGHYDTKGSPACGACEGKGWIEIY